MNKKIAAGFLTIALFCMATPFAAQAEPTFQDTLPSACKAKRMERTDIYHGVRVEDPYYWLENVDSKLTKDWIKSQNSVTDAYLAKLPKRAEIRKRLNSLQNYQRYSPPFKKGNLYFYSYNSGLKNQSILYKTKDPKEQGTVLLDPNGFSKDGTVSLAGVSVSPKGNLLAYATSDGGSDWNTWRVMDIKTGKRLPDKLEWVKFSDAAWSNDEKGFYYCRYPASAPGEDLKAANKYHTMYYHKIGTLQADDKIVFGFSSNPDWSQYGLVSNDGKWLIDQAGNPKDDNNLIIVKNLQDETYKFRRLPLAFKAKFAPVEVIDDTLYCSTDLDAPNNRVVKIDLNKIDSTWQEVIPERKEALESVSFVGGVFFCQYLKDAHSQIVMRNVKGEEMGEVSLPGLGSADGFYGDCKDTETFYSFTSYTTPSRIYRYDIAKKESTLWRAPEIKGFDPKDYITKQVFVKSKDSTLVPMCLSYKKNLKLTGYNPVLMYGYGGFNYSLTPYFSNTCAKWMEMNGIYAAVNLRGGGEYGENWHKDGTKTKKQNVFDDFISSGEWLVKNNYTKPQRLAIMGGSNGGLLVGACLNQRPDLFGAAVPQVGVMDMLKYASFTIGYFWEADYGNVKNEDEFRALYAYSPYHNVKECAYPPTLITTADHDDRVFPAHSFKYAAALQNAQQGQSPILIRIDTRAGHGSGKPTSKRLDETADILAFLANALKM